MTSHGPVSTRRVVNMFAVIVAAVLTVGVLSPVATQPAAAHELGEDLFFVLATDSGLATGPTPTNDTAIVSMRFGGPGDQPLIGDWNCDGVATPGAYRTHSGQVFVTNGVHGGSAEISFSFGNPGDVALAGDFNGDGCDTIAVYRAHSSFFYVRNSLSSGTADRSFAFGNPGDLPIVGDFNGDGADSFAVYRPSDGKVHFRDTGVSIIVGRNQGAITADDVSPLATTEPSLADNSLTPTGYAIDIELWPGDDLRSIVSNAPVGTVFRINGVHSNQSIAPRDGQVFVGAPGATLRGDGVARAFSSSAEDVVIEGLEITGYQSKPQRGAVQAEGAGWVIRGNEIHDNAGVGVRVYRADRAIVAENNIHHNGQLGIAVAFSSGTVVEDNEIAFNNWQVAFSWGWEAGGTKFWKTDGLIVRNNWSHHNHGPGLWSDTDNINILYEGNLVEDNYANGIFHEIGYDAVIRNNIVRRNGFGHDAWLWGAGILIAASQNVEIYGNEVTGNFNGITMVQQNRGSGAFGPYVVRNNVVRDNVIVDSGVSGAAEDIRDKSLFSAASGNDFRNNTYLGDVGWEWGGGRRSWSSWQHSGLDSDGSSTA